MRRASVHDAAVWLAAIPGRVYVAAAVLAATLATATWLYTYRVSELFQWVDGAGKPYHPSERVRVQPWWSTPATIAVVLIGVGATVWLLPKRKRLVARTLRYFAKPSYY